MDSPGPESILIMIVRLSLSKVIVRLSSVPRTASPAAASAVTSRATSASSWPEREAELDALGQVRGHRIGRLEQLADRVEQAVVV